MKSEPIPYLKGRALRDHIALNRGFILACHHQNWPLNAIARAIGIRKSGAQVASLFGSAKMGRSHLGFEPLTGEDWTKFCKISGFIDRVKYRGRGISEAQDTLLRHCARNRDLILDMHAAQLKTAEMAFVLEVSPDRLHQALATTELTRKALGLAALVTVQSAHYQAAPGMRWTPKEDLHIRRGHYCGFPLAAVAGLCRRSGLEVTRRAQHLGLGAWPTTTSPRERQRRACDFDDRNDVSLLSHADGSREDYVRKGLDPDAAYAR